MSFLMAFLMALLMALLPGLLTFFLRPILEVFCQHLFILHHAVEPIQVEPSTQPLKMSLQPTGHDLVGTPLVRIGLDDGHDAIYRTLQCLPVPRGVLDAEHAAKRRGALCQLLISIRSEERRVGKECRCRW